MNPASAMNAISLEKFNTKKPEEVINSESLDTYETLHSDIWHRLIQVHTNIIILEKIEKFPFEHFYPPRENIFWAMVYWNFLYISVAFLHSLVSDETKGAHTLLKFKNRVLNHLLKDSLKSSYLKVLKTVKLDKNRKSIRAKISDMRNKVISHRFLDSDGSLVTDVEGVTLEEVRQAYDDVEKLFRACSFGADYLTTFYIPGTVGGKPVEKDIDELLDLIVKNSSWLNQPERREPFWPAIRQHKDPKEIEEINLWRRKFGLPDA